MKNMLMVPKAAGKKKKKPASKVKKAAVPKGKCKAKEPTVADYIKGA